MNARTIADLKKRRDRELAASARADDPTARASHAKAAALYQAMIETGENPTDRLRRFE